MTSILNEVIEQGIQFDNHVSDLYIPVNEKTKEIIKRYPESQPVLTFRSAIDGTLWYDLAFKYTPFWANKTKEIPELESWREERKPDKNYGQGACYVKIFMGENCILSKFPFSSYMGSFNGYNCIITNISSYKTEGKEFSVQVYKNNERVYFQKDFKSLQSAYIFFCWYTHNK